MTKKQVLIRKDEGMYPFPWTYQVYRTNGEDLDYGSCETLTQALEAAASTIDTPEEKK